MGLSPAQAAVEWILAMADWYYVGHYGELGPLTREQFDELIEVGVITRETYVWKSGMTAWLQAFQVPELASSLATSSAPDLPPSFTLQSSAKTAPVRRKTSMAPSMVYGPSSPKSRVAAGVLNILLPGVGRMYLGYVAHGILQLFLCLCSGGVLILWPIIDGILILTGSVHHDGYGRILSE